MQEYHIDVANVISRHRIVCDSFKGGQRLSQDNHIAPKKPWLALKTKIYNRIWSLAKAVLISMILPEQSFMRWFWLVRELTLSKFWNSNFDGQNRALMSIKPEERCTFTFFNVVPYYFTAILDEICRTPPSLTTKLLDYLWAFLSFNIVFKAKLLENIQINYTSYCKFSRLFQFQYSMCYHLPRFHIVLFDKGRLFCRMFWSYYFMYYKLRSILPASTAPVFSNIQWYLDCTAICHANSKLTRSFFTLL